MTDLTEIRISRVRSFAECWRYAVASLSIPWDGRMHVATWIGSTVHARLCCEEEEPKPDDLIYDRITSTAERADDAVDKIMDGIAEFEEKHKPRYIGRELPVAAMSGMTRLTGTIDMLCEIDGRIVIVDLKTGRQPYTVWVQTAMYAWLADRYYAEASVALVNGKKQKVDPREHEPGLKVDALACLHVPRVGPKTDQRWSYEQRDYSDFEHDVEQWSWMLDQLAKSGFHELNASPGMHCMRCPVEDCAVRGAPQKKD